MTEKSQIAEVARYRADTAGGASEYADSCGMTEKEFWKLLDGKDVLDLGSGKGILAIEAELRKQKLWRAAPRRVDSLNANYADPEYKYTKGWLHVLQWRFGREMRRLSVRRAIHAAAKNRLALDWRDLSSIEGRRYGVIVSFLAFPVFSDIIFHNPPDARLKAPFDKQRPFNTEDFTLLRELKYNALTIGEETKQILSRLIGMLDEDGTMILGTSWPMWIWTEVPGEWRQKFEDFLRQHGCTIEAVPMKHEQAAPHSRGMTWMIKKVPSAGAGGV